MYHDSSLGVAIEVVTVKIMYMDSASVSPVGRLNEKCTCFDVQVFVHIIRMRK